MTTTQWIFAGAGAVVTVLGGWLSVRYVGITGAREKERAFRHMLGKPPLDVTQFGQHYFPAEQSEIATRIRRILAGHIPVDLSRLHPDDRLVEDIRMDALDSMSTVEFVLEVEKEFGISIPDAAVEDMRASRDIIDYVTANLQKPTV